MAQMSPMPLLNQAPPPTQDFFVLPDKEFVEWWASKNQPPTPHGHVIPVKTAMQGHPESPRLWERHIDRILRELGLTLITHNPAFSLDLSTVSEFFSCFR